MVIEDRIEWLIGKTATSSGILAIAYANRLRSAIEEYRNQQVEKKVLRRT